MKETDSEYGMVGNSGFLIQRNKEGGSEFIPEIPRIMYEVFGRRMSQVAGTFFGDLNT
jgi:hypothetical protein